jgi:GT2 family glycosyltransferase
MPNCSVIIPVYNKASLTRQCLDVLLSPPREKADFEIIVVDDASTDRTPQLLAGYGNRIRVVRHQTNAGFATAVNDGVAAASGEYLVFLNNDTIPQPGWLDALVSYAHDHPRAAAVGSKLLLPNGTIQHAGVVVCQDREPSHIYAGFPADHPAVNKSRRFQIVTAACVLMRRGPFEEVGGFDTAFRNSCEDVDLCLRLGERGYEIHYCHESVLYHLESVSDGRFAHNKANVKLLRSRWAHRLQPDDLKYYLEDGLLNVTYWEMCPFHIEISPLLAVVEGPERARHADALLKVRARQVYDLLRDNILLNVRVREAELRAEAGSGDGAAPAAAKKPETPVAEPRLLCRGAVHWLSNESTGRLISLILPVKNGAAKLRELLPRIFSQRGSDHIEVVAMDCGSTDETVDVLRQSRATVVSIDPRSFSHDLIRDLATRFARGSLLVFLNQSTLPADDQWLAKLVAPLDRDPTVAGVCFTPGGSERGRPVSVLRRAEQRASRRSEVKGEPAADDLPAQFLFAGWNGAGVMAEAADGRES